MATRPESEQSEVPRDEAPESSIDDRTIGFYLNALASAAPTPGGGSGAGVAAALAAALAEMVCNVTLGRPSSTPSDDALRRARDAARDLRARFLVLAGEDEIAFRGYATAIAMPKGSQEEKAERRIVIQAALREAADVPLRLADACLALMRALDPIVRLGNTHVLSDAVIAVRLLQASIAGAALNVRVNASLMKDAANAEHYRSRIATVEQASRVAVAALVDLSEGR